MVRQHITALRLGLMSADGLSALALFILVSIVRFGPSEWQAAWATVGIDGRLLAFLYGCGWVTVLWLFGLYRLRVRRSARTEVTDVAPSVLLLALATVGLLFLVQVSN